jgi:hypothetical protein
VRWPFSARSGRARRWRSRPATGSWARALSQFERYAPLPAAWRGLAAGALFEGRDLQPTIGLDALIASAAGECFGLEPQRVSRALFPQVRRAGKPLQGMLRA